MSKTRELREMSDEQIRLVWKDSSETLFKLRLQAQTEKLASPSDLKKHRRTIARCQTLLGQRGSVVAPAAGPDGAPAEVKTQHDAVVHGKHAKKKRISGRAKVKAPGKGVVASRRRFQKRTQSGT
jgi:large subunit ribosomal protein L29